ncbi:MAG TPA: T9SS type A sorting domain-containing protein, partial [Saprospiraceae bacterium]|nr:T9SS type A sorting domain-containing protein [Saprospiraceae bacterium]
SNWFRVNNGFIRNGAHLDSVFSMDANDSLVYAGTDDVGFYRTDNNGDDWKLVDSNTGDIHAIKLVGQNVYYGTVWGGVHSSFDNGKTFAANNTGLKFGPTSIPYLVKDFLVMDTLIFAATDIGVFRQAIPNILTSANKISSPKNKLNIYPNPTSGSTNFKFTLTHSELVCITIYDYVGKEINTLINTFVEPGEHTYNINTRNLDAGIYYVKFVSGNEVNVYSLISLK